MCLKLLAIQTNLSNAVKRVQGREFRRKKVYLGKRRFRWEVLWAVPAYLVEWSGEEREYVVKARAYLVSAHVFYKVNYALCPVVAA